MYVYAITHVHRTVGPDASDVRALAAVAKAIIHKLFYVHQAKQIAGFLIPVFFKGAVKSRWVMLLMYEFTM